MIRCPVIAGYMGFSCCLPDHKQHHLLQLVKGNGMSDLHIAWLAGRVTACGGSHSYWNWRRDKGDAAAAGMVSDQPDVPAST